MIAASIWSLILPAVEMSEEQGSIAWIPASMRSNIRSYFFTNNK